MSTYFGVYIPTSKAGCFEGSASLCVGSIAAVNIKPPPPNGSPPGSGLYQQSESPNENNAAKYEDPDYPSDSPLWLIFTEKSKALDVLRQYKEARLREFPNLEQAESYVQFGFESIEALKRFGKAKPESKPIPVSGGGYKSSPGSTDNSYSSSPTSGGFSIPLGSSPSMSTLLLSSSPTSLTSNSSVIIANGRQQQQHHHHQHQQLHQQQQQQQQEMSGERPPFQAPTKQELAEFRRQIEGGHIDQVKRIVWKNPRYLISSGDTPTSLKEGCRYNAMHICAQVNKARIAQLLLKIISDREFTQLYAGKKGSSNMCAALNESLLDYYLNMPDKSRGETPLHFAAKNGHVDMVELLISHPECKSLRNHEGKEPREIICLRNAQASNVTIRKLQLLLNNPFFVPVLRSNSNTLPPQVGQPFTPTNPPSLQHKTDECEGLSVDLKISAVAGPMSREKAMNFYRRWKTPPRVSNNASPLGSSPFSSPMKVTPSKSIFNRSVGNSSPVHSGRRALFSPATSSPKRSTTTTTGQPNGSNECESNNNDVKTEPHLEFPATPIRQMKPDLFMAYRNNNIIDSPSLADNSVLFDLSLSRSLNVSLNDSFQERHIKNSDIEKGLEVVGRQLARQEQCEWREYWDFIDSNVDISTSDGLARFEAYLLERAEQQADKLETVWNFSNLHQYLDLMAGGQQQQQQQLRKGRNAAAATATGHAAGVMTPYTCVEKSLQVFAKRITKTLINKIGNMVSINDTLLCELKRLKSLIVSFKDDVRFMGVDFSKVHSRIAHLVASYVTHSQEVSVAMRLQLLQMLRTLRQLLADERGKEQYLGCVCGSLLVMLEQAPTTAVHLPDTLKTEELCSAAWETEQSCACLWDANLSRKTSQRKRTKSLLAAAVAQAQLISQPVAHQLQDAEGSTGSNALHVSLSLGAPKVAIVAPISTNSWRDRQQSDDEDDESDEEANFFDCSEVSPTYGSSSEDEEQFRTPPESLSPRTSVSVEPRYELFIFGNEPTKRDRDVLDALLDVDVEKETYPHVHAWKTAMEGFSSAELNLFPSPKNVKMQKSDFWLSDFSGSHNNHSKRLLATPKLNAVVGRRRGSGPSTPPMPPRLPRTPSAARIQVTTNVVNGESGGGGGGSGSGSAGSVGGVGSSGGTSLGFAALSAAAQTFQTPLNKVRGLFSKYRDQQAYNELDSPLCANSENGSGPETDQGSSD
ncbi:ankyrin repeat and LEM domain-containing protein 2 homolog [Drosophila ficusphila]|uniref:ankyrin repeat and LEM domain-containing protein 2 homolog n=1 Tax=Drosophila ficusphila TaxID=30025 RepID=UPI0007E613B5|nr:ankyrin repeat and LEM domain-containing protein 2 homolog [Drosophila ficusphila]